MEIGEKEKEAGEEGGKKSASRSPSRENGLAIKQEEEEKQKKEVESVQAKRNYRSVVVALLCSGEKRAVERFRLWLNRVGHEIELEIFHICPNGSLYCNVGLCILFSVVFCHSSPGHHYSIWLLYVTSLLLTNKV